MITVTALALIICLFGGSIASERKQKNECTNLRQSKSSLRDFRAARCPMYRAKNLDFPGNVALKSREIEVSHKTQ
jgi:hypothetical protein